MFARQSRKRNGGVAVAGDQNKTKSVQMILAGIRS